MGPKAESHRIAVLKQDNGELAEDVVPREETEPAGPDPEDRAERQSAESFPASDPPSTWSGPDEADRGPRDRLVSSAPVEDVPERPEPGAAIPGTLPRSEDAGQDRGQAPA